MQEEEVTPYVPFQDSYKCEQVCSYCGISINADCHNHKYGCSYSCNKPNPGSVPIGDGLGIMFILISIYIIIKTKRLWK